MSNLHEEILPGLNDISAIAVLSGCDHRFCCPCMLQHCEHSVVDRSIPILCPYHGTGLIGSKRSYQMYKYTIFFEVIKMAIMIGNLVNYYLHGSNTTLFNRCKKTHSLHCTQNAILLYRPPLAIKLYSVHGHSFCSLHGNEHHGITCREFQKAREAESRQEKLSCAASNKLTEPCSHCDVPIKKEAGCDHIICPQCKQDFCSAKCGTHTYSSGA